MKKKPAKKAKRQAPKKPTVLDRLPKTHGEYLQTLIRLTERYVKDPAVDVGMHQQAERLRAELAKWNEENK